VRPQRAYAYFVPFTVDPDRGGSSKSKISYMHVGSLVCTRSGVVEKQEKRMVPVPEEGLAVKELQDGVHV